MIKTQNKRIIDRLLANPERGITSLEAAMMQPAIMRLSERVRELEADGALIYRADERTIGARGKYTRYFLRSLENYMINQQSFQNETRCQEGIAPHGDSENNSMIANKYNFYEGV